LCQTSLAHASSEQYDRQRLNKSVMKTISPTWSPETLQDRNAVLVELDSVLASPHFSNSKRYPALLRYIVERTLEGRADSLKERTLGIEVFQRPADYDTNADTVVRYTAGEVRKRLAVYYHQHEPVGGVQITLPVGSYVPEFLKAEESTGGSTEEPVHEQTSLITTASDPIQPALLRPSAPVMLAQTRSRSSHYRLALVILLLVVAGLGLAWKIALRPQTAIDQFWAPTLHEQGPALICPGGNVFNDNNFSGTLTAGKDIQYPFVSMQIASGIARVSGLLERGGAGYQIQASASAPLGDLRERPVILLGGYNNLWTMRLVKPLRFQFPPEPFEGIVDRDRPDHQWVRDKSQPYASTEDYALIARFRDSTTGSIVIVLAGLGRNGTEGAAQFVTSPHYMQLVEKRLGRHIGNDNIEIVIKVSVIDGKTGAPSIEDIYTW
jgi:hypothetical protein